MGVWTELVGARRDLRLRSKWWHHAMVGLAWFSAVIVYLIVAGIVARRAPKPTTANTFSLTLLNNARVRKTTTVLADLDAASGILGQVGADSALLPLPRTPGSDVRCENQARYKSTDSLKVGQQTYRAIPDSAGQPVQELRHCVATPEYASLTASSIVVYIPDGTAARKAGFRALFAGIAAVMIWLIVYWNVYYRGLMPFYALYRRARKRRHLARHSVRQR